MTLPRGEKQWYGLMKKIQLCGSWYLQNKRIYKYIYKIYKKRPEPKFGSLFGAEDGTFPRTKKQSTGLFFAACGRPCCSSPRLRIPNKNPHGGVRHGDLCLVRKMGLEPTRHRHTHLKRACLPIPALPQIAFDCKKDSSTFGGIKSSPILQLFPAWRHHPRHA